MTSGSFYALFIFYFVSFIFLPHVGVKSGLETSNESIKIKCHLSPAERPYLRILLI